MPLSDYERRALEQIETALTDDSPRLAGWLRAARLPRLAWGRGIGSRLDAVRRRGWLAQVLLGLLLLLAGLAADSGPGILLGVISYLLIIDATHRGFTNWRQRRLLKHPPDPRGEQSRQQP